MESVKRISVLWPVGPYGYGREQVVLASEFDRVSAENLALQQRLTVQDQRVDDLKSVLERMLEDDDMPVHWFAQRIDAALKPTDEAEPQCLLCLDKKTVPGNTPGGFVKDCPECCGEEG